MVFLVAEWLLDILGNQYYMIIIFVIGLVVATFLLNKEEAVSSQKPVKHFA